MRSMRNPLLVICLSLGVLAACGPVDQMDGADVPDTTQVEQGIGQTPNCGTGGSLQSKTVWGSVCKSCTEVGGDGSWPSGTPGYQGSLYQRCCYSGGTCGSWQLIRPVCSVCELL